MQVEFLDLFHLILISINLNTAYTACSSACTSCSGSTCTSCEPSYYLTSGNCISCPENCNTCDSYETCTSCKSNKWGILNQCTFNCVTDCLNTECHDDNGFCLSCKPGKYGSRCWYDCSICKDSQCDLRMCLLGCKSGYYDYSTGADSETFCQSCPSECKTCKDGKVCSVCNDGFYLQNIMSTESLVSFCIQCPKHCKTCDNFDSSQVCTECNDGYMLDGDKCVLNKNYCNEGCSTTCNENGTCLGSCIAGWTGDRCSDSCSNQCFTCVKNNSNICYECKDDYYTVKCDVSCNQSCIKTEGKQTCRQSDGYCLNGCENKFWGQNCDQSCADGCADDGKSRVCDRANGKCTNGCVVGYTGDTCETMDSKTSTTESAADTSTIGTKMQTNIHGTTTTEIPTCIQCHENTDTTSNFITGYMSGVGTAIFVVVIIVALYHLRRRYIVKKSKPFNEGNATEETSTHYNENAAETREPPIQLAVDANNYESLASNRKTEQVYSDLESQAQQQSHSYYNLDAMK